MISLKDFIVNNPLQEKIIFVKNKNKLRKEFERLALDGVDIFSVKIHSLKDFLIRENSSENISNGNIERIVLDLQETGDLKYFDKKFNSPLFFRELKKTISRIRLSGYRPLGELPSGRAGEIIKILKAYEDHLEKNNLVDYPILLKREVKKEGVLFAVPADLMVHKLERDFLNRLSPTIIHAEEHGSNIPRAFYSNSRDAYKIKIEGVKPTFKSYFSESEEVSSIFEEIAREGISSHEVEIVVSSPNLFDKVLIFGEIFGLNIYPEGGFYKKDSKLGHLLFLLKSFTEENGSFGLFKEIMEGSFLEVDGVDLVEVLNELEKKKFHSGRWNYQVEDEASNDFLGDFLSLSPKNIFSNVNYSWELDKFIAFFNKYLKAEILEENIKLFHLLKRDRDDEIYDELTYSLFIDRLISSIEKQKIESEIEAPYILLRQDYSPFTREYAYVLGMTSPSYPMETQESKILSDLELDEISKDIIGVKDEMEAEAYYFQKMLSSFTGKGSLRLSCSRQDPATGLENLPHIILTKEEVEREENQGLILDKNNTGEFKVLDERSRKRNRELLENFTFSYTSLDELMKCPKCFYYKRIWGLDSEVEKGREDMDPLEIGNLYHNILDIFIKWGRSKEIIDPEIAKLQLLIITEEEIEKYKASFPPKRLRFMEDSIMEARENIFKYFFLVLEDKIHDFKRMETERPFDRKIRVGKYELRFRGRVDRLEYYDDHIVLVDMKTGKRKYKEEDIAKNRSYQDFVYKRAFEDYREFITEYHFLRDDNIRLLVEDNPEIERKIELTLDLVLEYGFISSRTFGSLPDKYASLRLGQNEIEGNHNFSGFVCRG